MVVDAIVSTVKGFRVFKSGLSEHYPALSVREQMVFDYLALGYSNQKIAQTLSLSEKTISTYKSRILQKYDTKSIVELVNLMHLT
ncbi:response regulator transcription factor [Vibrio sp. B172a]|uniref:response regulator transcription factor n=1 Tax=Vibrio sp. B172a TaxID=2835790 RepID=UPI00255395A4|nr:LuxR C-terminal-related transcriptional regulator [Vibrio sp. B172a]